MNTEEASWWRCALYAYQDSDWALDRADGLEARKRAVAVLADTVEDFLEGRHNFGTLKYRMDSASGESGTVFPPRPVSAALSDLALGVPIDDLEPAVRTAGRLPEDPGEAKGLLMDFDMFIEREVSRGHLKRERPRRWVELMACLWHIQDPSGWPAFDVDGYRYLEIRGEVDPDDPIQGYAEYAALLRRVAEVTGADMASLEHLLSALGAGLEVPGPDRCYLAAMAGAGEAEQRGETDQALALYERALTLQPRTPQALRRKTALYEAKGLFMAAIGEAEALVELEPSDLPAHRKLIALYKSQGMVREHNIEVRRFRAIMGK